MQAQVEPGSAASGLAGGSWVVGPDGEELARTNAATPIVTIEIDLADADAAKSTYPRNVRDLAALPSTGRPERVRAAR